MKLTTAAALLSLIPSLAFAQTCSNGAPDDIGYGNFVKEIIKDGNGGTKNVLLAKRGGSKCPCSYVSSMFPLISPNNIFVNVQSNGLFLHILFYNRRKLRVLSAKEKTKKIAVIT